MTNADRIRNMTDEELATELIYEGYTGDFFCSDDERFLEWEEAFEHEKQWLRSEVKEGE